MALEAATYVNDLVTSNPAGGDSKSQGDDHMRLIKAVLKTTFPNATGPWRMTDFDAGGASGPYFEIFRDSASPADNDNIGGIKFLGRNESAGEVIYGAWFATIIDATAGTEDARLRYQQMVGGVLTTILDMNGTSVTIAGTLTVG